MRKFWKQPQGINGLLYGQPATIVDAPKVRAPKIVSRDEQIAAINTRAHNSAIQFERDRKQAAKAARRRIAEKK